MLVVTYLPITGLDKTSFFSTLAATVADSEWGRVLFVAANQQELASAAISFNRKHPGRCTTRQTNADDTPLAQARDLVTFISALREDPQNADPEAGLPIVIFAPRNFPAALWECTVTLLRESIPARSSLEICDPTEPDPYIEAKALHDESIILPQNTVRTVDWQDLEFREELLDSARSTDLGQAPVEMAGEAGKISLTTAVHEVEGFGVLDVRGHCREHGEEHQDRPQ